MKTYVDCVPCIVRQAVDVVRVATPDETVRMDTLRAVLAEAAKLDFASSPPAIGGRLHRVIREVTGNPDPYLAIKERCNRLALERLPALRERVRRARDPFEAAVRLAIAGNVMDFGVLRAGDDVDLDAAVEAALSEPFAREDIAALEAAVARAGSILYLADNAGEIVFDRLLLERLPAGRTVVVVKDGPVINDALRVDAEAAGITADFEVVTTGSDFPGAILEACSPAFRSRFASADLVVAKGQAHFETLEGVRPGVFFLLRAKCPVVSRDLGVEPGGWLAFAQDGDAGAPAAGARRNGASSPGGENRAIGTKIG